MSQQPTTIPLIYRLTFLYVSPAFTLAGAWLALYHPEIYFASPFESIIFSSSPNLLSDPSPSPSPRTPNTDSCLQPQPPTTPLSTLASPALATLLLTLGLLIFFLLRLPHSPTTNTTTTPSLTTLALSPSFLSPSFLSPAFSPSLHIWHTFVLCLSIGDLAHLLSQYQSWGPSVYWRIAEWGLMGWGNVGYVYLVGGLRVGFLMGVGVRIGMEPGGKAKG